MVWTKRWRKRLRILFRREAVERELEEELAFHVEMETKKNVSAGMSAPEARRQAALSFGARERFREEVRDARWLGWASGVPLDLKLGWRMLVKSPGLTLVGVLSMAVGIALCASVFSVLGSVLARSLPMDEGDRVVAITSFNAESGESDSETHLHDLAVWREELTTVAELGAFRSATVNIIGEGAGEPLSAAEMTASGFRIARTPPHLGRYLVDEDERSGAQAVVVIGYKVWTDRFGAREDIVGRTMRLATGAHTIVGVMPEEFGFPIDNSLWVPLRLDPLAFPTGKAPDIRVFGRLSPDATVAEAQVQIATIGRRLAAAQPATHEHLRPTIVHYTDQLIESPATRLALQGARFLSGILLLVIAVNVAILVYARTASRTGEIAVRTALGASRRRVVTQLFAEAVLLSTAAAALGLVAAALLLRHMEVVARQGDIDLPYWVDFTLSPATVAYASALTLFSTAIVGALPALKATDRRAGETLRHLGGATGMRMGPTWTVLIGVQSGIAIALLPLVAALLIQMIRFSTLSLGPSIAMERIISASVAMEEEVTSGPSPEASRRDLEARFADRRAELLRRLEAEPGIEAASFASDPPGGGTSQRWVEVAAINPTSPPARHAANSFEVGPGVFELYGARLLAGLPLPADGSRSPTTAAVVSESFVEVTFGGGDPLGRRFRYATKQDDAAPGGIEPGGWYEVVGVVGDFPAGPQNDGSASVYHPVAPGRLSSEMTLLVRAGATATPEAVATRVWAVISELDPALQVSEVRSLAETARIARSGSLIMLVGGISMTSAVFLLCAAGMHALVAFTVAQRRREIGVRIALGARPRQVVGSILTRAARQVAIGLGLGALAAAALIPAITESPGDATLLITTVAPLLLLVGLLSALGPARRGLRIQPMEALRQE